MTAEEQNKYNIYIKKKSDETEQLLIKARDFTLTLFNEKTYTEYLILMSRFHRYSFINILLIKLQFSSASYLAGFETWKTVAEETFNDPSYQILQREHIGKGIKVLIPFTLGDNRWQNRKLINIPVSVYDIKQMNKLPTPEPELLTMDIINDHLMEALRSNTPYHFILADKTNKFIQAGMHSYFDNVNQFIIIDDSMSEYGRIVEYIRTWVKKEMFDFMKQKGANTSNLGFATASAEYVIRTALGLNTQDIAFNYISQYTACDQKEFWLILHCIQTISHLIIEQLTENLLDLQENLSFEQLEDKTLFDYDFAGVGLYEV